MLTKVNNMTAPPVIPYERHDAKTSKISSFKKQTRTHTCLMQINIVNLLTESKQTANKLINMKVSIIGAGAMGGSIARGLLSRQQAGANTNAAVTKFDITVSNPSEGKLAPLAHLGAHVTHINTEAVKCADLIILCVKPWLVEQVINEIKPHLSYSSTEVAVVAAGIPMATLAEWLRKPGEDSELPCFCISMPNTAVSQCQSMTFQVDNDGPCNRTLEVFSLLGSVMVIPERLLPAATSRFMRHSICHALRARSHGGRSRTRIPRG